MKRDFSITVGILSLTALGYLTNVYWSEMVDFLFDLFRNENVTIDEHQALKGFLFIAVTVIYLLLGAVVFSRRQESLSLRLLFGASAGFWAFLLFKGALSIGLLS